MFQPTNPLSTTWNQDIINELSAHAPSQAAREVHSEASNFDKKLKPETIGASGVDADVQDRDMQARITSLEQEVFQLLAASRRTQEKCGTTRTGGNDDSTSIQEVTLHSMNARATSPIPRKLSAQEDLARKSVLRATAPPFIPKSAQIPKQSVQMMPQQSAKQSKPKKPRNKAKLFSRNMSPKGSSRTVRPLHVIDDGDQNQEQGCQEDREAPTCVDGVKGWCNGNRWKRKYSHSKIPFEALPGRTILQTLMSHSEIVPQEGERSATCGK
jgi:hypothetical protein